MPVIHKVDFCLLIPCFNNEAGLVRSLQTVQYSPGPFMVVIVDDGSGNKLEKAKIQHGISKEMDMILLRMEQNGGIRKALNAGLSWIMENVETEYVARLDCGDLCEPVRFTRQSGFMREHPELVLSGSWCYFRNHVTGEQYRYITATTNENIIREMYRRNVFMHPTVMFRTNVLAVTGFYPAGFELAEDYAFFWTLMKEGEAAVINEFLVTCEINKAGLSFSRKGKQVLARWKVVKTFGKSRVLKLGGFLWHLGLLVLPKELILWLKKKKA